MRKSALFVRNERGAGRLKTVVWLAILGAGIYAGIQLLPIYWDHYNFVDTVRTEMKFAFVNYPRETQESLENVILSMLNSMDAEFEVENLTVRVDTVDKESYVDIVYWRSHHLPYYENPKKFHISLEEYYGEESE